MSRWSWSSSISHADGVTVVEPLRQQWYGDTDFVVKDLNGYVLVFAERR
jgi:uncharacterized glyoxalase superfamily protein PhnB